MSNFDAVYERLRKIREKTDLSLKPCSYMVEYFTTLDGKRKPFTLRYYQVQMVAHLLMMRNFVVGDDTGCGKCCREGTLILTNRGLRRVEDLGSYTEDAPDTFTDAEEGLEVLVGGESLPVRRFYYGGVKPTLTVRTRNGFTVSGSRVHPLFVLRDGEHQWVQLPDIQEGDYLCVERTPASFPQVEPRLEPSSGYAITSLTPDMARFLGYYIGEGGLTAQGQVRISQSPVVNPEVHADIKRLYRGLFTKAVAHPESSELVLDDTAARKWLAANGLGYTLSKNRVIPDCILQATEESCREFLMGLFEGEGHVSKSCIEYSTASEELGHQVQVMLLRFGIISKRCPKKVAAYPDNTYWRLFISGADAQIFQERLGFVSSRKSEALSALLDKPRNTNTDVIPHTKDIFETVRRDLQAGTARTGSNGIRKGSGLKQFGFSLVNTLNNIRNCGRNPSYTFVEKVVALLEGHAPESKALPVLQAFLKTCYFYDPVATLEEGEAKVFDIEVEDDAHAFVGNGLVNHNTIETIGALCYLWDKNPNQKVIILTKKSAVPQWAKEFLKFTKGVHVVVQKGTPKQRKKARDEFLGVEGPSVLLSGYRSMVRDFSDIQYWEGMILVLDEVTMVKNPSTQVHQVVAHMAHHADRVWGLTATLIKNNLVEGFGIYKVVVPGLFTHTKATFIQDYCITRMQVIGRGRQVPIIVGYRMSDIQRFRGKIDPFYLGRPKHQIATELPVLTTREVECSLTNFQATKYQEALNGLLELGTGEEKEVTKLTAVTYCQEIVNHPGLIECQGSSDKLDTLTDLLTEGDLEGEKVIIYTRFERMVGIGVEHLESKGVKCVRITGKEKQDDRSANQDVFQDFKSGTNVVWITNAGSDAINLQAAKAIIFYDTPFSAGDFLQALGRMIRIGSIHDRVLAMHLVCTNTIDERVLRIMGKKMDLLEAVLGKRILGEGETDDIGVTNEISDIFDALTEDARGMISVR